MLTEAGVTVATVGWLCVYCTLLGGGVQEHDLSSNRQHRQRLVAGQCRQLWEILRCSSQISYNIT